MPTRIMDDRKREDLIWWRTQRVLTELDRLPLDEVSLDVSAGHPLHDAVCSLEDVCYVPFRITDPKLFLPARDHWYSMLWATRSPDGKSTGAYDEPSRNYRWQVYRNRLIAELRTYSHFKILCMMDSYPANGDPAENRRLAHKKRMKERRGRHDTQTDS
jgi:hypothetical protein